MGGVKIEIEGKEGMSVGNGEAHDRIRTEERTDHVGQTIRPTGCEAKASSSPTRYSYFSRQDNVALVYLCNTYKHDVRQKTVPVMKNNF